MSLLPSPNRWTLEADLLGHEKAWVSLKASSVSAPPSPRDRKGNREQGVGGGGQFIAQGACSEGGWAAASPSQLLSLDAGEDVPSDPVEKGKRVRGSEAGRGSREAFLYPTLPPSLGHRVGLCLPAPR